MYKTARIGIEVSTDDGSLCDRPETSESLVPEVCVLVTCSGVPSSVLTVISVVQKRR